MTKNKVNDNQIEMVIVENVNSNGPAELVISPKVPSQAVKTRDKVSNFITQNMLDAGEQLLEFEKKGRIKKQIRTKVTFSYEGIDIQTKKEFTLFDQEVHDAVVTLYMANNQIISPAMVYRAMTGKTQSESINTGKLKEIEESIDKCMWSKLSIDASEEASAYGYKQAIYSGPLLAAEKVLIEMGGNKVIAYKILTEPLLYRYAKSGKQIAAVDIKLLDTPVVKTSNIIVLQGFLLRQIESMKSDRKYERMIRFDDIYTAIGLTSEQRTEVKRIRESVKEIFEYWKEKGYIEAFEYIKKGNKFLGVTVYLN